VQFWPAFTRLAAHDSFRAGSFSAGEASPIHLLPLRKTELRRTKREGPVSEKSTRRALDCAGESRMVRNRSVFRLQMQLWPCNFTRERYYSAESDPKKGDSR
jgi:hypothetical protein